MTAPRRLNISHPWFDEDFDREFEENRRKFDQRRREIDAEFERPPKYWSARKLVDEQQQSGERRGSFSRQAAEMKELPDKFEWSMDVREFAPEDLKVTVTGNVLTLEGNHDELNDKDGYHSKKSHHFSRKYTLPANVDLQGIESTLTATGQLVVEAPKCQPSLNGVERRIPVGFSKNNNG